MNKPVLRPDSLALDAARGEVERRRTFAIISHPDAGKTTLTEKLLLFGGAINLAGQVKAKRDRRSTRSDWMAIERERGISVVTSVMTFDYDGRVFNLLDTPGHEDFSEDTYRTLTAVELGGDGDRRRQGHRGAHPQAVRGLPAARHPDHHLHQQDGPREPRPVRTAGRDRKDAGARHRADDLADRARPRFRRHLRYRHAARCGCSARTARPQPPQPLDLAALAAKNPMLDVKAIAEELALVKDACRRFDFDAFREGHLTPVFFGSALKNFGVKDLLDALAALRAGAARASIRHKRTVDAHESAMTAFVFKIQANMDPNHRDRIAFARLCSGKLRAA